MKKGRYFVKFTVEGVEGHYWTDMVIWEPEMKSLKKIFELVLDQAKSDIMAKTKKAVDVTKINIITFNLIHE